MTTIDQIIKDAETAKLASKREGGEQSIINSADWLEQIARQMREELKNVPGDGSPDNNTQPTR